ncbi:2',3'-cyclic-nucleotide 3'-phosphodiesterase [Osmerus mordax]|uniref:2',3'-cyclic-nucleotide 3'-phosphodiesterase n=1 Tax=Osmerus mordax TaxID=8014 RepID=UPI0035102503
MDVEQTKVLDLAPETQDQLKTATETVPASKLELHGEHSDPEKLPVTVQETEQLPLNANETVNGKVDDMTTAVTESAEESKKIQMVANQSTDECTDKLVESEKVAEPEKIEVGRSVEKVLDPVSHMEPENIQNLPEKTLEALPLDEPLAASHPVVVQLSEPVLPESQKPEDVKQLCQDKVPEQSDKRADVQMVMAVEPDIQTKPEVVKAAQAEVVHEVEAEPQLEAKAVNVEAEKPKETEEDVMAESPIKEEVTKKPAQSEDVTVKGVDVEKPEETETVTVEVVAVEMTVESKKLEQQVVQISQGEEPVPAPGSLSFALLQEKQTMATLRTSRTLIILRGLPGSGKSLLAQAIADSYKDLCTVCCADDHGVKPESPEASAYKALEEAVVVCCSAGPAASVVVVVDDTNHTHDQLVLLGELAEQHRLVPIFLEPRTEWNSDFAQLAKKSRRGLEEAQIQAMMEPYKETALPLFFGWFLFHGIQDKVRCTAMDFLKTLDTLEAFKKHLTDFTGEAEKEVDLEQYFQPKGPLHCTTKFCDYGKAEGAREYAEKPAVKEFYGSASELSLSALFVTPRTVGARVSLTENQLVLWPADEVEAAAAAAESGVPPPAPLPLGSRAHITLGCAEDVEPVQTGLDLLEILALQEQEELVEMELGSLAYYGKGRWLLSLREPVSAHACFTSLYGPKKVDPAKKESEKKKKPKCTIL